MPDRTIAKRPKRAGCFHSYQIGVLQMALTSFNTRQIAHTKLLGAVIGTFIITYVWLYVVRYAIHKSPTEQFFYAVGCCCGTFLGITISAWFYDGWTGLLASF